MPRLVTPAEAVFREGDAMKFVISSAAKWMLAGSLVAAAIVSAQANTGATADTKSESKIIKTLAAGIPHSAFFGISFDAGKGVAVGAGGAIFGSADAGKTWMPVQHGLTELALLAVDKRGAHTIAVGQAAIVMIEDSPGHWAKIDMGEINSRLFSVSVNSKGLAFAVGEFGTVIKSTDGGRTWAPMAPNWASYANANAPGTGEPNIYAVNVSESGEITLAGEFGVILRSVDGGAQWRVLRPVTPQTPTIFALHIPRDGTGVSYAVGQTGELLQSADRGVTWVRTPTNTKANFLGVAASGDQVVVTGMRVMYRSQDAGKSWKPVEEGDTTTDWYQAVRAEASSGRIVAVGHAGRIIQVGG